MPERGTMGLDDAELVRAILDDPPRRQLLPPLGRRAPEVKLLQRRAKLFRALSITEHAPVRALLFSGLTEPLSRQRGSLDRVPLEATPESARLARLLIAEGWPFEELRDRLVGLRQLWQDLDQTAPDSWRALDVCRTLCDWHEQRRPVSEIHRGLLAAEALWRSDPSETGVDRLHHLDNFLAALIEVF